MKTDPVSKFLSLREQLLKERKQLLDRLRTLDKALGRQDIRLDGIGENRGRGRPPGGSGADSLREIVVKAIGSRALTKQQVLEEVHRLGYRFSTTNPLNSLGTVLYGKHPRFRNERGYFSLPPSREESPAEAASQRKRRQNPAGARMAPNGNDQWKRERAEVSA